MADATDAELAVLEVLWADGAATRRQLADALYPGGGPAHYTTVQKLLERLEAKGFVQADRSAAVRSFRAVVDREQFIRGRLRDVADKLCGGSLTPLLLTLAQDEKLTPDELKELRALVRRLSRERGGES